MVKLNNKLKQLIEEWSLLSTFHCYPKIFQTKSNREKWIWSLIFILFSCLTFWLLIKGILDYLEFDVVTKIRVISSKSLNFPTLTICDSSLFTTKEAELLLNNAKQLDETFYLKRGEHSIPSGIVFNLNQLENYVDFVFSNVTSWMNKRNESWALVLRI